MAAPSPEDLFQQAEWLIKAGQKEPPHQVDIRRAISSAYYGLFHFLAASVAGEFAGPTTLGDPVHGLIYRSLDHAAIKNVCNGIQASRPDMAGLVPGGSFGPELRNFGVTFVELQGQRHAADYDPLPVFRVSNVVVAVLQAREAIAGFGRAGREQRRAFLALLAFRPRR